MGGWGSHYWAPWNFSWEGEGGGEAGGYQKKRSFFASESWRDVLGGCVFLNEMDMSVHIFFVNVFDVLIWCSVSCPSEGGCNLYWNILPTEKNHHCMMSFHLSIFFCLLVTQGWLKPIKQNITRPSSHSDRIRKCWKPGSVWMISNSYANTQKCNYTSGNSTWDLHMSGFKHGYVDAILCICMFNFHGVIKLQKRLGMWKFEEARKH